MRTAGGHVPPAVSRRRLLAAGWLLALLAVAGCGGTTSTTAVASSSVAPTAAVSSSTAPSPTTSFEPTEREPALDVQGHRGARGLQPENTLPAFETALDLGVATLELDLHFTADGEVVVWHDPTVSPEKCELDATRGLTGPDPATATEEDLAIAGFAREELRAYRCASNPDRNRFPDQLAAGTPLAGDNYEIVTLGELFDFVAAYVDSALKSEEQRLAAAEVAFNIETKRRPDQPATIDDGFDGTAPGPFELAILEIVADKGLSARVIIQSFDHRSLRAIRSVDQSIRLAALSRRNEPFEEDFATFANIWSPDYRSLSAGSLEAAHDAGLLVIPWTVNETTDMNRLIDLGVDGLITDRPDLLVEELAAR